MVVRFAPCQLVIKWFSSRRFVIWASLACNTAQTLATPNGVPCRPHTTIQHSPYTTGYLMGGVVAGDDLWLILSGSSVRRYVPD